MQFSMSAERIPKLLESNELDWHIGDLESDRNSSRHSECGRDLWLSSSKQLHHHGNERPLEGAERDESSRAAALSANGGAGREKVRQSGVGRRVSERPRSRGLREGVLGGMRSGVAWMGRGRSSGSTGKRWFIRRRSSWPIGFSRLPRRRWRTRRTSLLALRRPSGPESWGEERVWRVEALWRIKGNWWKTCMWWWLRKSCSSMSWSRKWRGINGYLV